MYREGFKLTLIKTEKRWIRGFIFLFDLSGFFFSVYICGMRISGFIMGILVLALSFMPCADNVFAMKSEINASVTSKPPCQNESGRADDCSPFCHCTCCAGFSIISAATTAAPAKVYDAVFYSSYISSLTVEIAYPIFQPPKL